MSLFCRIFGHPPPRRGWWGDGLYGSIKYESTDNIGRTHYSVRLKCDFCEESVVIARFHGEDVHK